MTKPAFIIIRIGLSITFFWIGVMILRQPEAWIGYIPMWTRAYLPVSVEEALFWNGLFDCAIGLFFLANWFTWIIAFIAAMHLIIILVLTGVDDITVRDIGLLGAALGLMVETIPEYFKEKMPKK